MKKLKKFQYGDPVNPLGQSPWLAKGQSNPLVVPTTAQIPFTPGNCPVGFVWSATQNKCVKQETDTTSNLNPAPPAEADPQYQIKSKATFGNINYGYRALSNSIQGIAAFFRERHNRAGQNAYYQAQFNPLTYIPETGNTSEQNQFGMDYALKGGLIPKNTKIKGKKISTKQRKFFSDLCKLEEGGLIKYPDGGQPKPKRKPIMVNNPNDPRLKAYQDSLKVKSAINQLNKETMMADDFGDIRNFWYGKEDVENLIDNNPSFKPKIVGTKTFSALNGKYKGTYHSFPMPVQPVVYQKLKQNITKSKPESVEVLRGPLPKAQANIQITAPEQTVILQPEGDYVYGPSNSVIGINQNGTFIPYDMPEQRGKVNQSDLEMLNNQEAMKKYVQGKGLQYTKGGPTDPSIVNFLESQGKKSDKESRRALAAQYGIEGYDFSSEKNLELLNKLRSQTTPITRAKVSGVAGKPINYAPNAGKTKFKIGVDNKPILPGQPQLMLGATPNKQVVTPKSIAPVGFPNHPSNYRKSQPKPEVLESGVIVDKRTGRGFVINNGKVKREFPTITGSNVELNNNESQFQTSAELDKLPKNKRATPVGYYRMRNIRHKDYGDDIMMLDPMAAFDKAKPNANQIAIHKTYDLKNRLKLYESGNPWGSYGCVNCKIDDMREIKKEFIKGDTLRVIDSKRDEDRAYINKVIRGKQYADGGEIDLDEEFENEMFGEPVVNNTQEQVVEQQETPEIPIESDWIDEYLMGDRQRRLPTQEINPDGENDDVVQAFKNGIAEMESNGDYYAVPKKDGKILSSAYGKYQFLKGTREEVRKNFFPDVSSKDFELAYKTDPNFQEKVMDVYSKYLLSKYQDPHKAAVAFFLGEGKANKVNQPNYNPGNNNSSVGSYLKVFDRGFNKKFEAGGEYDLSEDEIDDLIKQGYQIDRL